MQTITPQQELDGINKMLDNIGPKCTYQQIDENERSVTLSFGYGTLNEADLRTILSFCTQLNFGITIYSPDKNLIRVELVSNQLK